MLRARECLDEIIDLFQSGTSENSAELLERVADLFFVTADQQSAEDRDAFGDVMERMAYAADPVTRARLAERISKAESAPTELIRRLARDDIFIARPILQYSPCLREGDLISISNEAEQDHLKATAHRTNLTKPVTDVIIKRGDLSVLLAVTRNTGAEFSPEGLAELARNAELYEELQAVLKFRRDLAPGPMARLKRLTEIEFWQQMAETILMTDDEPDESDVAGPAVNADVAEPAVNANVADKDVNSINPASKKTSAKKTKRVIPIKAVQPSAEKILLDAARNCNAPATIESFANITHLDKTMIEHCMFNAHISALMVLCKAHSFAPATFTAMVQLRESKTSEPNNDTAGLMRRYESMTPETAERIIRFSDKRRNAENEEKQPADG